MSETSKAYGPHAAALEHAGDACRDEDYPVVVQAVWGAHDPALGLDRSVCLRDVIEVLERMADGGYGEAADLANRLADEFGSGNAR